MIYPFNREQTHRQFSFICSCCGEPLRSTTTEGQDVVLIYVKDGCEVERLTGQYDGFGGVFTDKKEKDGYALERKRMFWKTSWDELSSLIIDSFEADGICAFHAECFTENITLTKSEMDENDGTGFNIWKNARK